MLWKRTKSPPQKYQTSYSEFVKIGKGWEGLLVVDGVEVQVLVQDIDSIPNPVFLGQIPDMLQVLPELEQMARQSIEGLSSEHRLTIITDAEKPSEFTLGFSWEEKAWGETVFVDIKGGKIAGWSVVD